MNTGAAENASPARLRHAGRWPARIAQDWLAKKMARKSFFGPQDGKNPSTRQHVVTPR
jgi:hypothetical protein